MDAEKMQHLLMAILDCGSADISILEGVEYDWSEVIEVAEEHYERITLKTLFNSVVHIGMTYLEEAIEDRIEDLRELVDDDSEEDESLSEELESLEKLDVEEDFETFFNFLDTHVYLQKNKEIYDEYLSEEIELFEENTGFNVND